MKYVILAILIYSRIGVHISYKWEFPNITWVLDSGNICVIIATILYMIYIL